MNLTEALEEMKNGKKVMLEVDGVVLVFEMKDGENYSVEPNDAKHKLLSIGTAALLATDWEIYNPEPVLNPCGCGGKVKIKTINHGKDRKGNDINDYYCECEDCMFASYPYPTIEYAVQRWNNAHPIAEKKRTNFEKYITAELLEDASEGCGECCARFVSWANAIAEEVKQ